MPASNDSGGMIPLEKIVVLSQISLFSMLKTEIIQRISEMAHEENYLDGEILFSEGDIGNKLFLIVSGEIKIIKQKQDGSKISISTWKKTDFLGELSLFDAKTRTATAHCVGSCTFLVIGHKEMERLLHEYPAISFAFIKVLINRMREMVLQQESK